MIKILLKQQQHNFIISPWGSRQVISASLYTPPFYICIVVLQMIRILTSVLEVQLRNSGPWVQSQHHCGRT